MPKIKPKHPLTFGGASPRGPAVFLDRDGVINALLYHKEAGVVDSPFTVDQFRVLPRVARAIRLLNDLSLPVIIVSNQPGIAKGHFGAAVLRSCDSKLSLALERAGAHADAVYYCLHHPEAKLRRFRKRCACRKPAIGLFRRAARELGVSLRESYMVGDGLTDIEAGNRAGCTTIFVGRWKCEHCQFIHPSDLRPRFAAKDLWEAAQLIRDDLRMKSATTFKVEALPAPTVAALAALGASQKHCVFSR
jgi:D-glycero-D-manno-heptose 1,7-bisphosphate phosphatase